MKTRFHLEKIHILYLRLALCVIYYILSKFSSYRIILFHFLSFVLYLITCVNENGIIQIRSANDMVNVVDQKVL